MKLSLFNLFELNFSYLSSCIVTTYLSNWLEMLYYFRSKPFLKRLERKPEKHLDLRTLSPNPMRDQPAQRFDSAVAFGFGNLIP